MIDSNILLKAKHRKLLNFPQTFRAPVLAAEWKNFVIIKCCLVLLFGEVAQIQSKYIQLFHFARST